MTTKMMTKNNMHPAHGGVNFAFFGTSHIAVSVIEELHAAGLMPSLIVTVPDRPQGRKMEVVDSAVKTWANAHGIALLQPSELDKEFLQHIRAEKFDVAIVCDYGKILPKELLEIPKRGFLNMHPSLLPRLRGSSPMRSAILTDEKITGVTIMLVDEQMDHGPIVAQKKVPIPNWPVRNSELEQILPREGGKLLAQILPLWVKDEIEARAQNHDLATFCEKFSKEDGLLNLSDDSYKNLRKIYGLEGWPGTYAMFERSGKRIRVQILDAHLEGNKLILDRVKPEGKREMTYEEFSRSGAKSVTD